MWPLPIDVSEGVGAENVPEVADVTVKNAEDVADTKAFADVAVIDEVDPDTVFVQGVNVNVVDAMNDVNVATVVDAGKRCCCCRTLSPFGCCG